MILMDSAEKITVEETNRSDRTIPAFIKIRLEFLRK